IPWDFRASTDPYHGPNGQAGMTQAGKNEITPQHRREACRTPNIRASIATTRNGPKNHVNENIKKSGEKVRKNEKKR
ncbi:MAG: hypothetical protein KAV42_00760, partial [Candidatus Krumholzibacteria bacterium]|nr:hypothetical protein [Candidatus Krumholzibacteria bacterium]